MKNLKALIIYGFLIWLAPFVLSFFIFTLRQNDRPLFETLMPLILSATIMLALIKYTRTNPIDSSREGFVVGAIWATISFILDQFIFQWGPLKMPFTEYIKDIGLIYLMIPIITTALGKIKFPQIKS